MRALGFRAEFDFRIRPSLEVPYHYIAYLRSYCTWCFTEASKYELCSRQAKFKSSFNLIIICYFLIVLNFIALYNLQPQCYTFLDFGIFKNECEDLTSLRYFEEKWSICLEAKDFWKLEISPLLPIYDKLADTRYLYSLKLLSVKDYAFRFDAYFVCLKLCNLKDSCMSTIISDVIIISLIYIHIDTFFTNISDVDGIRQNPQPQWKAMWEYREDSSSIKSITLKRYTHF